MAAATTNTRQLRENLANYEAQLHQVALLVEEVWYELFSLLCPMLKHR